MLKKIYMGVKDGAVTFSSTIDKKTGFMHVDAIIARTGIQKYLPAEVDEKGDELIGVFRSLEEVTHTESLDSFVNVPVTDNHPPDMVNIENHKKYAKGSISSVNVVQLGNGITALKTQIVITDKSLIESIRNGKKELSVGYENALLQKTGTYDGEDYNYIQTDIRANHIAVVDAGRCGDACKLMIDKSSMSDKLKDKGVTDMKITIKGTEFEVVEEVAAEIKRLLAVEEKSAEKSSDEETEEKEEKKEAMDKLQATVDTLTVSKVDLEKQLKDSKGLIDAGVQAKLDILTVANDAKVKVCTSDSIIAIKKAIVKSFDMDIDGKSEVYLDACIDIRKADMKDVAARKQKALDSINKVGDEYTPDKTIDAKAIGETEIN